MEKLVLLKHKSILNLSKYLKNKKKKKKTSKILKCLLIIFFMLFAFKLYLYPKFIKIIKTIKMKEKQRRLLTKINEYILICRNGRLINDIQISTKIPKVTVVLTLYNSEKTITTSVRSIQNQNFSDFEIIIIDDYSIDNGFIIIKSLQKEDQRIKIIKNKKNRGPLYSRSIGALNAKGKYIFPLDSDDLFANDNLFNICYNEVEKFNIDILEFSGIYCIYNSLLIIKKFPKIPLYFRYKKHNLVIRSPNLSHFIYKKSKKNRFKLIDGYLCGKIIKSKIYKTALNLLGEKIYTQNICYGEDRIVNFFLFKVADSFKFIKVFGLVYNLNRHSITRSHKKIKNCHDEIINIMSIYNYTKNSQEVEIAVYEIIHRWNRILYPGIKNKNNKISLMNLINQMLNCKYINEKDKLILKNYYKKISQYINK